MKHHSTKPKRENAVTVLPPDFSYVTAVNAYGFYCIPDTFRQREVSKLLMRGKVNEPRTLQLIQQCVGTGDIVSGGAFVGDFLPAMSRALCPGAHLHSFEPNPVGFAATSMTILLNDLNNVRLSPVAVGRENTVLPLLIADASGRAMGGTSRIVDRAQEGKTIDVQLMRIDELVPEGRKVSVLQLDVEGHEGQAIEGAERTICEGLPLIVLETLAAENPLRIQAQLRALCPSAEYTLIGKMERNAFYRPVKWQP